MSAERQKARAAAAALEYVESGMTLGLGSGSTAEIFLRLLGERVKEGLDVRGVPTSRRTAEVAQEVGVPLIDQTSTPSGKCDELWIASSSPCRVILLPVQLCSKAGAATETRNWGRSASTNRCRKADSMPSSLVTNACAFIV